MEEAMKMRLTLRCQSLKDIIEQVQTLMDAGTAIDTHDLTLLKVSLKSAIEGLTKETYVYLEKVGIHADVKDHMELQLKGEQTLSYLESSLLLTQSSKPVQENSTSRLPKLDVIKFNGDLLKFQEFWDRFEATVHAKNLKDVDKLAYLMASLEGVALETVEGIGTTNLNYPVAVNLLRERFGDKDRVVDAHYKALNGIGTATNNAMECRRNLNLIERHLRVLTALEQDVEGSHLRVTIASKFPAPVIYQVKLLERDNSIKELRATLDKVISAMERAEVPATSSIGTAATTTEVLHITSELENPKRRKVFQRKRIGNRKQWSASDSQPKRVKKECAFCKGEHFSDQCNKFTTVGERKAKLKGLCFLCLRSGHIARNCRNKRNCIYCRRAHNRALCPKKLTIASASELNEMNTPPGETNEVNCFMNRYHSYLQTATVKLRNNRIEIPCRVLLDSGSQRSYLTTKAADQLKLNIQETDVLVIFTFGSSDPRRVTSPSSIVTLTTKRGIQRELRVNIIPHITDRVPIATVEPDKAVDITADDNTLGQGVDLLIGNDYYFSFIRNERMKLQDKLYLVNTNFGWIVSGSCEETVDNAMTMVTYCQCHGPGCPYFSEPDLPLRSIDMKFLWNLESIGITDSPKTTREEEAVKHFNETVKYCHGRYEVKWPWIDQPAVLPTNFGLAYGRLKSLLRRSNEETLKDYAEILQEQLSAGIIEVVDQQSTSNDVTVHYLPHHMVKQEGKRGRIVYDASAKCNGQKSLNECLYRGPSMIEDMTALLLQFRSGEIGMVADVEKAFLQVGLQEEDREVTRFLWVKDTSKEPTEDNIIHLRFCRVPFGIISSPFLLTATIRYHFSRTNQSLLSKIADRCYIDNLVTTANSVGEAHKMYHDTRHAFEELSMNIRDWTSNSKEFMANILEPHKAKSVDKIKVLGLLWNLEDDTVQLKLNESMFDIETIRRTRTKKDVLSMLARFYDPCGFIAPLILPAKLLFQDLCTKKLKWDVIMPEDSRKKWERVVLNLQAAKDIRIKRYAGLISTNPDTPVRYELHGFTDASKNAYAAVVYLKTIKGQASHVNFMMSKSRVTPLEDKDDLKIPRLELLGFLIGSRLLGYVKSSLGLKIGKSFLWTDSLKVLNWINTSKLLPPFVSRRVNEIKNSKDVEFCYVNTNTNPADLATRPELWEQKKHLWFNGPTFLSLDEEDWPSNRKLAVHTSLVAGEALDVIDGPEMVVKGYETAYPSEEVEMSGDERCEVICPSKDAVNLDMGQSAKLDGTQVHIKKLQAEYFPDEVTGKETSLTRNLGLFMDIDGVLRCKGRMSNANWLYDKKHPILIPRNCQFTSDVIRKTHEDNYHVGVSQTLSIVRQKYWVPQGRIEVQKVLKTCPQCVKHGGGPYQLPQTPSLPPERVNYSVPFTYTGMDYFGPMLVKTPTGPVKRWICLFTCLAVRAVHLEVVMNSTADECLLAIRRFTATRGIPLKIVSDNALQFKLMSEILTSRYCKEKGIQWKFIPQLAPWHGEFYERLVALAKHCLKRTLDKHLLTDSQLVTVVKEVEAVMNARPLVHVGSEPEHILKPADFLNMGECLQLDTGKTDTGSFTKVNLIEGWRRGRKIMGEFIKMFQDQYLLSLRERYRHSHKQARVKSHREPRVGDLVQIKDDCTRNRCNWKVGKIATLVQGSDGECRVAKVKVGETEFTRSVAHLYPLEAEQVLEEGETSKSRSYGQELAVQYQDGLESVRESLPVLPEDQNLEDQVAVELSPPHPNPTPTDLDKPTQEGEVLCETVEDTMDISDVQEAESPPEGNGAAAEPREPCESEVTEVTRQRRAPTIKAREKIAEWTRQLFHLAILIARPRLGECREAPRNCIYGLTFACR